jgi:formamidopyrimidine-DNA glycosylase
MPELPEVETIIRRLRNGTRDHPPLPGRTIQSVRIQWKGIIAEPDAESFPEQVRGKTIQDARRRAKYLHFPLDEGHIIAHLRMSGDMRMEPRLTREGETPPPGQYDRILLNFSEPWRLTFVSVRKFGRMWYVNDPYEVFGGLGPEPLSDDFTAGDLYGMLQAHSRQIKPLLLDQTFIAGLGNIYTDESLHRAEIHPLRKSDSLSREEAGRLFTSVRKVLQEGIRQSGSSLDWVYRGGQFQNHFRVYKRGGQPCPVCGKEIQKISVGQRGTHFCPRCQPEPRTN